MNTFAREQTMARLERFEHKLRDAGKDPTDADAIHDLRVANRRLTQCLYTFSGFLNAARAPKIRKKLKRLMDRCAGVRNCDIALELLETAGITANSKPAEELKAKRKSAEKVLARQLRRWRSRNTTEGWADELFAAEPVDSVFDPDLNTWVKQWFASGRLAAAPGATHETMHQFRLEGKRLRYAIELLRPLYGSEVDAPLKALRELQNALGRMNDCVTALELLKGHPRAERALRPLLKEREQAFRDLWMEKFGKRRLTEWTSIFSATALRISAAPASRKPAGRSPLKASAKSAA